MQRPLDSKGLNIAHLNIASMLSSNKSCMLREQINGSTLDIFCASETWLNDGVPNKLIEIPKYNVVRQDRRWKEVQGHQGNKRGGGLICFIKDDIVYNKYMFENLNCSCKDLEMLWVSLEFKSRRRIVIINVCRPPQGDYKKACTLINEILTAANLKCNVDIFLLGDFNINMQDKKSSMTKELVFTTSAWGLAACFSSCTRMGMREGRLSKTCIDNIFTNSGEIIELRIYDWNLSDHLVIVVLKVKES